MRATPTPPPMPDVPMNTSTIRGEHEAAIERMRRAYRETEARQAEHQVTEDEAEHRRRQLAEDALRPMFDALDENTSTAEPPPASFGADLEQAMRDYQADN